MCCLVCLYVDRMPASVGPISTGSTEDFFAFLPVAPPPPPVALPPVSVELMLSRPFFAIASPNESPRFTLPPAVGADSGRAEEGDTPAGAREKVLDVRGSEGRGEARFSGRGASFRRPLLGLDPPSLSGVVGREEEADCALGRRVSVGLGEGGRGVVSLATAASADVLFKELRMVEVGIELRVDMVDPRGVGVSWVVVPAPLAVVMVLRAGTLALRPLAVVALRVLVLDISPAPAPACVVRIVLPIPSVVLFRACGPLASAAAEVERRRCVSPPPCAASTSRRALKDVAAIMASSLGGGAASAPPLSPPLASVGAPYPGDLGDVVELGELAPFRPKF